MHRGPFLYVRLSAAKANRGQRGVRKDAALGFINESPNDGMLTGVAEDCLKTGGYSASALKTSRSYGWLNRDEISRLKIGQKATPARKATAPGPVISFLPDKTSRATRNLFRYEAVGCIVIELEAKTEISAKIRPDMNWDGRERGGVDKSVTRR